MRLCEQAGPRLRQSNDSVLLRAALCANRRFIFLNSLANTSPIKEPNVRSTAVNETAAVLPCFLSNKKWGRKKWIDTTGNSWTSK
jgi:hypothetical protein